MHLSYILLITMSLCIVTSLGCDKTMASGQTSQELSSEPDRLLRHVVLFKFNETSTPQDVKTIEEAFAALPQKISNIYAYEWGLNNSPEGLEKGFTHCFILTFLSEDDRDVYLPHPDHKAFGELLGPHLADVLVVDYWSR